MTYSSPSIPAGLVISQDKMDKIIDAVIDGKYSYACLIMLEEAGYDPAQYITYRTYNRLQKQHRASYQPSQTAAAEIASLRSKIAAQKIAASQIADIDYVDSLQTQEKGLSGGYGACKSEYGGDNLLAWPASQTDWRKKFARL